MGAAIDIAIAAGFILVVIVQPFQGLSRMWRRMAPVLTVAAFLVLWYVYGTAARALEPSEWRFAILAGCAAIGSSSGCRGCSTTNRRPERGTTRSCGLRPPARPPPQPRRPSWTTREDAERFACSLETRQPHRPEPARRMCWTFLDLGGDSRAQQRRATRSSFQSL